VATTKYDQKSYPPALVNLITPKLELSMSIGSTNWPMRPESSLLNKSSHLAATLGVTKNITDVQFFNGFPA
jgi:hypothetical protein